VIFLSKVAKKFFAELFFLLIFLTSTCVCCSQKAIQKKPKVVVLTSKGGNGHMAACDVLKDMFPEYDIVRINPIYDFFKPVFDGEAMHVSLVQNGWLRTANFIIRYPGQLYFKMTRGSFKRRLSRILSREKPDLLISLIPLLNYPAAWAAEHHKIPFLIITLDADLTLWLLNMDRCKKHNFMMTVQSKTPRIKKQLAKKRIPSKCVKEVGCPLRKEFFLPKNIPEIRKTWKIPAKKKIVLLMRGGSGSNRLIDYVKTLVELDVPIHVLVCVGKNKKLARRIKRIKASGPVTFSVIPFTKKIPDLMAISDLLITQPSPNVCNEAMHMNLPILVDRGETCLFWEKATIDWIKLYGEGSAFKRMKQLKRLVQEKLEKKREIKAQKQKRKSRRKLCFASKVRKIVKSLLSRQKRFFNNSEIVTNL